MSSTDTTTTNCASCGKEGGNLNTCNKCNMVTYCNAACKKKHRSKHKKACERRVAELHDEELFKEHPREECPICYLPLPLESLQTVFKPCCGKLICKGCICAMIEEACLIAKKKGTAEVTDLCAFCRAPTSITDGEEIERLKKLVAADNAYGYYQLAGHYSTGDGVPQDIEKSNELYLKAGELGCEEAYYNLGCSYENGDGVEMDKKKAKYYYELAAMNGNIDARHYLGITEGKAGNYDRAFKHFILSARAGDEDSLDWAKKGYMGGKITKDEYANTLRVFRSQQDEMKSDDRDKAIFYEEKGLI